MDEQGIDCTRANNFRLLALRNWSRRVDRLITRSWNNLIEEIDDKKEYLVIRRVVEMRVSCRRLRYTEPRSRPTALDRKRGKTESKYIYIYKHCIA